MKRSLSVHGAHLSRKLVRRASFSPGSLRIASLCALALMMPAGYASAQVITIDTHGNATTGGASGTVDRRFQQIKPTNVPLPQNQLDAKTRLDLIRFLEADQGFAMRPISRRP